MEVNIREYLSEDEIKEICIQELRSHVRNSFTEKDLERIMSNSAFYKVFGIVDDLLPEDYAEKIVNKTKEIIDNQFGTYEVFREKSPWGDEASKAQKIMEKTIDNMAGYIEQKTKEAVEEYLNGIKYEDFMEKVIEAMWAKNKITFNFSSEY